MNFKNLNFYAFFVTILSLTLISCSDDDDNVSPTPPGDDTFEIIAQSENHNTLEQALLDTGLDQALNDGVYTVFAPTDAAFNNVDLSGLSNDQLTNILLNHVLDGETFAQAPAGSTQSTLGTGYVTTLATEKITGNDNSINMYVNVEDNVVINGNSTVTTSDINANNGVVHVVDEVITLPTVTTFAVADPTFDNLQAALTRDDQPPFADNLSTPNGTDPAPFTVFAPTNGAFGDLLNLLGAESLADVDGATLTATLNNHVIPGAHVRAADLSDGDVSTLEDDITINAGNATITDQNGREISIVVTDVQTANGVIHAVDQVILPSLTSTFDIIANSPDHTTLEQALVDTGLDQVLDGGNFTVFAPTDAAFNGVDLSGLSDVQLTNVLLNHVLTGTNLSTDLSNAYVKTNATESYSDDNNFIDMYVNVDSGVTLNDDATVTSADLQAFNGIVHVVDEVITLPNVVDLAAANPEFSNLATALTQENLLGTLSTSADNSPAPFTVFAPDNDAFQNFINEDPNDGFDSVQDVLDFAALSDVLTYHVLPDVGVRSGDISDGIEPATVQGETITINVDNGVTITDQNGRVTNIIATDVTGSNGVIHVLDNVILPTLQ